MSDRSVPDYLDWHRYDTILLDMDGTVLDLAFDNYFWRELVPRCFARQSRLDATAAREDVFERYARKEGSLDWYCLDYWSDELGLDLRALKLASSHRIRFLPGAKDFLLMVKASRKRLVLVTNAHADALAVKRDVTGLREYFDEFVSSHELGYAKEDSRFWEALSTRLDFDPDRVLFVDDSLSVLNAASAFGLQWVVAVSRPDTRLPVQRFREFPAVEGVDRLIVASDPQS